MVRYYLRRFMVGNISCYSYDLNRKENTNSDHFSSIGLPLPADMEGTCKTGLGCKGWVRVGMTDVPM
jgi:hypothetical protein